MEFSEEKASQVIEKLGLDPKNIIKWRFRKSIPDKYFKEESTNKMTEREVSFKSDTLQDILLSSDKINTTAICEYAGVKREKVYKVKSKKATFSESEIVALRGIINKIKIEITEVISLIEQYASFSEKAQRAFLVLTSKKYFFIKNTFGEEPGKKVERYMNKTLMSFPTEYREAYLSGLILLKIEISKL